ncbi:hypothetical protein [Cupriavidus sp. TMH.W2]|uniref:hypothetical protein n=1 Tax=Cupriavidus sp. TMH.W2 TaxID=3434465 RepID=UPI003D775032
MIMSWGCRTTGLACAVAVAGLLAGCERLREQAAAFYYQESKVAAPTVVLGPGHMVVLAKAGESGSASLTRESAILSGFDKCPEQDRFMTMLSGPALDEGRNDCIVLDDARTTVTVQVAYLNARRAAVEQWAIKRVAGPEGERVSLVPPSGALLLDAPRHI